MKIFLIAAIFFINSNLFGYIEIIPPFLFLNEPKRSTQIEIKNNSDLDVEIWFEIKYGYVTNDDSNKIVVKFKEQYDEDDQVSMDWTSVYPTKLLLKPHENRYFRVIVNPPLNLSNGEYWSRILVNSKPLNKRLNIKTGSNENPQIGFEIQNQQSLPFHYRKGSVKTGIDISNPEIIILDKEISIETNYTRLGNSSYWGIINFELRDKIGKVVKSQSRNIAVYKTLSLSDRLNVADVPKGDYMLRVIAETKRNDGVNKHIIKSESKTWNYNIKLE